MSLRALYVDPGKTYLGAALFCDRVLESAALLRGQKEDVSCVSVAQAVQEWLRGRKVDRVICERPSFWRQGGGRGNSNDILDLMATDGAVFALIPASMRLWAPVATWKGQVPKDVMCRRILTKLSVSERALLGLTPDHNVVDAVGIGLWDLKRL